MAACTEIILTVGVTPLYNYLTYELPVKSGGDIGSFRNFEKLYLF